MSYEGPGRYRHYKGGEYEVLGLALREESKGTDNEVTEVVYRPLTLGSILEGREEVFWTRVLEDFNEQRVRVPFGQGSAPGADGESVNTYVKRFEKIA